MSHTPHCNACIHDSARLHRDSSVASTRTLACSFTIGRIVQITSHVQVTEPDVVRAVDRHSYEYTAASSVRRPDARGQAQLASSSVVATSSLINPAPFRRALSTDGPRAVNGWSYAENNTIYLSCLAVQPSRCLTIGVEESRRPGATFPWGCGVDTYRIPYVWTARGEAVSVGCRVNKWVKMGIVTRQSLASIVQRIWQYISWTNRHYWRFIVRDKHVTLTIS